jgi:hypothetical protein
METKVIGFDVRFGFEDWGKRKWDEGFKEKFLLKPDLKWIFTVDKMVWPSYFVSASDAGIFGDDMMEDSVVMDAEDLTESWLNLSRDEKGMLEDFKSELPDKKGIAVGVELVLEKPLAKYDFWKGKIDSNKYSQLKIPEHYCFLGFDVADQEYLSGLCDGGFTKDEIGKYIPEWRERINEFGLFGDVEHALKYRKLMDKRAPDYEPFYVYGLYAERDVRPDIP